MNMRNIIIIAVVAITFGVAIYLVSDQGMLGEGSESAESRVSKDFGYENIRKLIGSLDKGQRKAALTDKKAFAKIVNQEALRASIIDAARNSDFGKNEKVRYLQERKADDFLVTSYINNRLRAAGMPKGFPSDKQIQQFYKSNIKQFSPGERLPVWQVFWRINKSVGKPVAAKLLKQASLVSAEIKSGKITFKQAAARYSQHAQSATRGGYMGVLQTSDLRPGMKQPLLALKKDTISAPIRSEMGLHIFRRGAVLPAETLPLNKARPQIVKALRQAFVSRQRQKLNEMARSKYPTSVEPPQLQDWMSQVASLYKKDKNKKEN